MTLVVVRVGADNENHQDTLDGGSPGYTEAPINHGFLSPRAIYNGSLFSSVGISGTVDDAKVTFQDVNFGAGGAVNTDISGDDASGSPGTFSSGDSSADRTITTTVITWDHTPPSGTTFDTPELKTIIQELVDSYTTLTNMGIFVINDGTGAFHDIESFTSDSTAAALATVNYTAAAGGGGIRNPMAGPMTLRTPLGVFG